MDEKLKKDLEQEVQENTVELSDEELGDVAGGILRRVRYIQNQDIQNDTRNRI